MSASKTLIYLIILMLGVSTLMVFLINSTKSIGLKSFLTAATIIYNMIMFLMILDCAYDVYKKL